MKFGLFSNSSRFGEIPSENYEADLDEIVVADRAGFEEVWISEHLGAPLPGAVTAPELLIAAAAVRTDRIRLGAGVRLLPLFHPLEVVTQAGFNDQLSRGRYNLGIGTGFAGVKNTERRGIDTDERIPRTIESLDFILRCWTATEPFDFQGTYYQGHNVIPEPRPYQTPHPPISVAAGEAMTELAGERGYSLLLGHWDTVTQLQPKVEKFLAAAKASGVPDPRRLLKVARMIYVAEDTETALEESRAGFVKEFEWRRTFTPHFFKGYLRGDETVDDLTVDLLRERGAYIVGSPDDVAAGIDEFSRALGGIGTVLVVAGKDFATAEGRQRSLELFASKVAPQLSGALVASASESMAAKRTSGADDAVTQPYVRVYAAENGDTRFVDEEMPLSLVDMWTGRTDATSELIDPTAVSFRRILEDSAVDHVHTAPARQFIVILRGDIEVKVSDGTSRRFGPGSIILMDDTEGRGHVSSWMGSDEPLVIVLKLSE